MKKEGLQSDKRRAKDERISLREKLCCALDLPPDALPGGSLIEIRGQNAMTVRGNGKILTYTPEEICVELGKGRLSVCGKRLFCISYNVGAVGIEGRIESIFFLDGTEVKGDKKERKESTR